jgi:hypothetical protein
MSTESRAKADNPRGLINHLLAAPDTQLDACMKPLIEKWDDEPTALQILEVLDQCIYAALASGFVITLFQTLFDKALAFEGKTHAEAYAYADLHWRKEH